MVSTIDQIHINTSIIIIVLLLLLLDTISFFHIFGSASIGPYYHGISGSQGDNINTIERIEVGWRLYNERFGITFIIIIIIIIIIVIIIIYNKCIGAPDRVMFNTIHWDLQKVYYDHYGNADLNTPNSGIQWFAL